MVEREEDENILCDLDGDEEYHKEEYEDHEPSYVIRRLMLTPKQEDNTQRHQLFRTRYTIGGRVLDLIVDSGSRENIISRQVVKKLQLPVEKHPNPYTIGWILRLLRGLMCRRGVRCHFLLASIGMKSTVT